MIDQSQASMAYSERVSRARALLQALEQGLDQHEEDQKADERSWGPVGDLGTVVDSLAELVRFLGVESIGVESRG